MQDMKRIPRGLQKIYDKLKQFEFIVDAHNLLTNIKKSNDQH